MLQEKEMTTLNPSVAADGEQSLTNHNNSITDDISGVNEDSVKETLIKSIAHDDCFTEIWYKRV